MFGEKLIAWLGLNSTEFDSKIAQAPKAVGVLNSALGQIGLGLGAGAVLGFFKDVIDRGGQLQDVSEQLGVTTDSLQALEHAGRGAGVTSQQLQAVWAKLSVSAAEVTDKNSSSAKALEKLGISAQAFLSVPLDRQLEMIAKAQANATDKHEAYAAVADLIGSKNAPRLNSVLGQLANEGLDGVTQKAREAGQVMSAETIARMDELGDRAAMLKTKIQTLGSSLLQTVFNFTDGLGIIAADTLNMIQGIQTDYSGMEDTADKVAVAVEKGNVALKGTKATADDLKRLDEARAKLKEKELTDTEKVSYWLGKIIEKSGEKAGYAKDSKEWLEAETVIAGIQLKMVEQRLAAEKKIADERRKLEEASRISVTEQIELSRMEKKGVDNLVGAERVRYDLIQLSAWKKREEAEINVLLDKGLANLNPKEKERYDHLVKATEETGKELAAKTTMLAKVEEAAKAESRRASVLDIQRIMAEAHVGSLTKQDELQKLLLIDEKDRTEEVERRIKKLREELAALVEIRRVGRDYEDQSTESLEYVANNLRKNLSRANVAAQNSAYGGYNAGVEVLKGELEAVTREINARQQFGMRLNLAGEAFTRRLYSPDEFERMMRAIQTPPETKLIAETLVEIRDRLKPVFKKK